MADTLTTTAKASVQWAFTESLDLSTITNPGKLEYSLAMEDGTTNGTADKLWQDTRSLATGNNDDLDLTALTNTIYGSTVTISFAEVCGIFIKNNNTTAGHDLTVGASGGNEWNVPFGATGDLIELPANGILLITNPLAGWAVTNGSADLLRIGNSSGSTISYSIVIWGRSA